MLGKPLLHTLDRMGSGGIILDQAGQILQLNDTAGRLISEHAAAGATGAGGPSPREALKALLARGGSRFGSNGDVWAVIPREAGRSLILHAVHVGNGLPSGPHTVVILIDLNQRLQPNEESLQRIFELTPAEARLAVQIAAGRTLSDIAQLSRISISTARTQLSSVFAKTHTARQAELVALLARVSILP
jgi:DNA-binding CsgD family transcriptional regulator